jgi:pyruvate kinase
MLSQETAIGAYPVLAIEMMAAVAVQTEKVCPYDNLAREAAFTAASRTRRTRSPQRVLGRRRARARALVVPTLSGAARG